LRGFDFIPTSIADLMIVQRTRFEDKRGFLSRLYCAEEFGAIEIRKDIAQINHTLTRRRGAVRGMHFQSPPHAEQKYVTCMRGSIFDVAVDMRKNSVTFLKWHGEVLSAENQRSLLIPEGFAHGFQALEDDCEIIYLHSVPYAQESESALNALDPMLGISWPLDIGEMSDRDRSHPMLTAAFEGVDA
jgi:dTDP-4-dehydrorhamnose 3,5-epimerase